MKLGRKGTTLRTVAFGTLDGSRWGVLIEAGETVLVTGDAAGRRQAGVGAPVVIDGDDWLIGSLRVIPAAVPIPAAGEDESPAPAAAPEWEGAEQLCTVSGAFAPDGEPDGGAEPVTCVGVRCELDGVKLEDVGSLRLVAAWFSEAEAAALVAVRNGDRGEHADDRVSGALFDPDAWIPSTDPRLSTTYDDAGRPTRCNLELWIEDGEDEYPRRVAGEAPAEAIAPETGTITVTLEPLVTHSRGHDGHGVYALATL